MYYFRLLNAGTNVYKCKYCEWGSIRQSSLTKHVTNVHGNDAIPWSDREGWMSEATIIHAYKQHKNVVKEDDLERSNNLGVKRDNTEKPIKSRKYCNTAN